MATSRRGTRRSSSRASTRPSFSLKPGRVILVLLLLAAVGLYVGPLRDFFAQQDRYHEAVAALDEAKVQYAALEKQAERLGTKAYIAQRAREDSLLVPPGTEVFVVKGLPGEDENVRVTLPDATPTTSSVSVLDRLEDLWRTLSE